MKKRIASLTLSLTAALASLPGASPAEAADTDPYFVADLSPGRAGISVDTGAVARLGGRLFFGAWTQELGDELFVTDGTTAGTHVVRDVVPGAEGSDPQHLLAFGGRLYYTAQDSTGDVELWTTDGTETGTQRVLDIDPSGSSRPTGLIALADRVLFATSSDSARGPELWTTQGTAATTTPITETDFTSIENPVRMGTKVIFEGAADAGNEPYLLDPATGTATLLRDINPGTSGSLPFGLRPTALLGDRLYFAAWGGDAQGAELWRTDGTPEGTYLVRDINPGAASSNPSAFRTVGGTLYFAATDAVAGQELWRTDGTAAGTSLVRDIAAGPGHSGPQPGAVLGSRLVFAASTEATGTELWTTQGTGASTAQVTDIHAGPGTGVTNTQLFPLGTAVYFSGYDGETHGEEVWRTDGTAAGTRMVGDVGAGGTWVDMLGTTGTTVFFATNDGEHGMELWAYRPPTPPTTPAPVIRVSSTTRAYPARSYSKAQGARKRIVVSVRVSAPGRVAQGVVTLNRRGVVYGRATLVAGAAKVRLSKRLRPGRYTAFSATYAGSASCLRSTSPHFRIVVRHSSGGAS